MSENGLVTGASGLIGLEMAAVFYWRSLTVRGGDHGQREVSFGPQGNVRWAPCCCRRLSAPQ